MYGTYNRDNRKSGSNPGESRSTAIYTQSLKSARSNVESWNVLSVQLCYLEWEAKRIEMCVGLRESECAVTCMFIYT